MPKEPNRPCLHLRCKEMYYASPAEPPSERELEERRLYGEWDNRSYWCHCTQTGVGPDDRLVDRAACSRSDRKCYRGLEHLA